MAQATVANKAFTDPRFSHLGLLLLPPDTDPREFPLAALGIGVMAYVWSHAIEEASGLVLAMDLDMIGAGLGLRPQLSKAIVQAGLAEKVKGGIRIRGTNDIRPDWKQKLNEANRIRKQRQREREANVTRDVTVMSRPMSRHVTGVPTSASAPRRRQEEILTPEENLNSDALATPAPGSPRSSPGNGTRNPTKPSAKGEARREASDALAAMRHMNRTLAELAADPDLPASVRRRHEIELQVRAEGIPEQDVQAETTRRFNAKP